MTGQFLDRLRGRAPHREVRAERVPQDVNAAPHRQPRPALRLLHPAADDRKLEARLEAQKLGHQMSAFVRFRLLPKRAYLAGEYTEAPEGDVALARCNRCLLWLKASRFRARSTPSASQGSSSIPTPRPSGGAPTARPAQSLPCSGCPGGAALAKPPGLLPAGSHPTVSSQPVAERAEKLTIPA